MAAPTAFSVLIADDAPEIVRRLSALIEEERGLAIVAVARDGCEAIEHFERGAPDAVVLDMNMPCATGLDVLRRIRGSGRKCVVAILTTSRERSVWEACLAEGADVIFDKARDFETVAPTLYERLASSRQ